MDAVDRQAFEIANDYSLSPDERKAQIDALYGETPPAIQDALAQESAVGPNALAGPIPLDYDPTAGRDEAVAADTGSHAVVPPNVNDFGAAGAQSPEYQRQRREYDAVAQTARAAEIADAYAAQQRAMGHNPNLPAPGAAPPPAAAAPAGPPALAPPAPGDIMFHNGPGVPGAAPAGPQEELPAPPPARYAQVGSNTFQPNARQVQHAVPLDAENEAAQREAEASGAGAQQRAGEAEIEAGSNARIDAALAAQKKQDARDLAMADIEDKRKRLDAREQDYRAMSEELAQRSSEKPFDANRYWANKSVGDKIMSRIALALGAAGSALTGAPNFAFQEMQSEVEHDIDEQKAEHDARVEAAGTKAKLAGSLYDEAKARFSDDREARMAALQSAWQSIDDELARFNDGNLDPVRQAKLDAMRAQTQQQIAQAQDARRRTSEDVITETQRFDPKRTVQVGGGMPLEKALELAAKAEKVHPGAGDVLLRSFGYGALAAHGGEAAALERRHPTEVHDVDGRLLGYARDPRTAAGYSANISAYKSVEAAAKRMIELQRQGGTTGALPTENSHRYKLAKDKLALELGNFYATIGKANLADVEVWQEDLPSGGTLSSNAAAALQQITSDARGALDERLRVGLGAKPPTMARGSAEHLEAAAPEGE